MYICYKNLTVHYTENEIKTYANTFFWSFVFVFGQSDYGKHAEKNISQPCTPRGFRKCKEAPYRCQ